MSGVSAKEISRQGLRRAWTTLAEDFFWERLCAEVLMAAKYYASWNGPFIREELVSGDDQSKGRDNRTVKGDLHDIGKKLVGMMFEGAGWARSQDLGGWIFRRNLL